MRRNIEDAEVDALYNRYVADLGDIDRRRLETRPEIQRFRPLRKRQEIPMLMFALEVPGGIGSRGLVYLGETDVLARGAKTGGFISEDSRIIDVLMEQIGKE